MKNKKLKQKPLLCPYCGAQTILRDGSFIHKNPVVKHLYVCVRYPDCDTYVGAHERTLQPMGIPANADLRRKRKQAHVTFDQLWQQGIFTRSDAYKWLRDQFFILGQDAHIASLSEFRCNQLIIEAQKILQNRRLVQMGGDAL